MGMLIGTPVQEVVLAIAYTSDNAIQYSAGRLKYVAHQSNLIAGALICSLAYFMEMCTVLHAWYEACLV